MERLLEYDYLLLIIIKLISVGWLKIHTYIYWNIYFTSAFLSLVYFYRNLNSHTKVEENNTITNFEFDNSVKYSYT